MDNSRNKPLLMIFALIVLSLVVYFTYTSINRINKVGLYIETFPADTRIEIDGRKHKRGTVYLEPGNYKIAAYREGFENYIDTLTVDTSTSSLAIMLNPITEEAKEMLNKTHKKDYDRARKVSYEVKEEYGRQFKEKNPITELLPDKSFIFSIGYIRDQSDPSGNSIIVTIDANEGYRQAALNRIHQLGYDPTDLNILFRDYENPFPL